MDGLRETSADVRLGCLLSAENYTILLGLFGDSCSLICAPIFPACCSMIFAPVAVVVSITCPRVTCDTVVHGVEMVECQDPHHSQEPGQVRTATVRPAIE